MQDGRLGGFCDLCCWCFLRHGLQGGLVVDVEFNIQLGKAGGLGAKFFLLGEGLAQLGLCGLHLRIQALQLALYRGKTVGHAVQGIVNTGQIASWVFAQGDTMGHLSLEGEHIITPEVLQSERHGKSPVSANRNRLQSLHFLKGINQGSTYDDLRVEHMQAIAALDLPGYAIGGLAVGESTETMYHILDVVLPHAPANKPRYLMGVGTPSNIIEGVARGVDFFDCVMPTRNARHGHLFTHNGILNINNAKYQTDDRPIEEGCQCPTCRRFSRAYLRHLLKSGEMLSQRLLVMHNLWFYNHLMQEIRDALDGGTFAQYRAEYSEKMAKRI